MRFAHTNNRQRAQRSRRDAERDTMPRSGPPAYIHGEQVGRVLIEYHGQRVEVVLLQAGDRCRSHGAVVDGVLQKRLVGLYRAAALASGMVARVPGKRSEFLGY